MKLKKILLLCLLFIYFISPIGFTQDFSGKLGDPGDKQLRGLMLQLLTLNANLEELLRKHPIDWKSSEERIDQMKQVATSMQQLDRNETYKGYLDNLLSFLNEMKQMSLHKNDKIMATQDRLKNVCLRCHTTHYRTDYYKKQEEK